jgi:hypothetical protein
MYKKSLFFVLSLLTALALHAQPASLLDHAIALTPFVEKTEAANTWRLKQDESADQFLPRLADAVGLPSGAEFDDIADQLEMNPFLGGQVANPRIIVPSNWQNTRESATGMRRTHTAPGSSLGGLSITNLADGFAKFLVARTKQELSVAFFEKFQEDVAKEPLRTVFPASSGTLQVVGKDIYQFNTYIEGLRESFEKDMRTLPSNLNIYVQQNTVFKKPYRQILAEDILDVAQQLVDGTSPDSIIQFLGTFATIQDTLRCAQADSSERIRLKDLAAGLQVVQLFSASLRDPRGNGIWYTPNAADEALRNPVTMYLYLGLLWNQGQNIRFSKGNFRDALKGINRVDNLRSTLRQFCASGKELWQVMTDKAEEGQAGYDRFYQFSTAFLNLLQTGTQFKIQFAGLTGASTATDSVFLGSVQHLNELHYDVRQRHYAAAVNDLISVLDKLLAADFTFRDKLFKYGHFMANVAEAEDSDQVAAAIEAVALPVGSARLKKEAPWSVSLNAYTGFAGGSEMLEKTGNSGFFSISAPLGLGINRGFSGKQSLSLYVPIIDVGALAAFRFKDPTAGDLPDLKFSNIFSPGAYLVWGFRKNWPIALGLGGQRGPNLRKIDDPTRPEIKTDSGWRVGAFLSVDIPVFNLWSGN